jgi:hypothetical protein
MESLAGVENMSESKNLMKVISLSIGVLLFTALSQPAFAAWDKANWENMIGSTPEWTTITDKTVNEETTWGSTDGSLPPSDLMENSDVPSEIVSISNFPDFMSGSTSHNGIYW